MDMTTATTTLAALAQHTRLRAFRELVRAEPQGLPAGVLAARLQVPANTLSAHLAVLDRAGLVQAQRYGRSIVYRAEIDRLRALLDLLGRDCCDGRPEACGLEIEGAARACCD